MSPDADVVEQPSAETETANSDPWATWLSRLRRQEWRTPVFFEIVSNEIRARARSGAGRPTVLDIGCGLGFDDELRYQAELSTQAGRFIGIEPDPTIDPPRVFSEVHRTTLESASITHGSIDVAYAVMVMEHVSDPAAFWSCLHDLLAPGGVFVAFSVNGAHWFAPVARFLSITKIKARYLDLLHGKQGAERYADYPVYYRTNTRRQIERLTVKFRSVRIETFGAPGNVAAYAPRALQPIVRSFDKLAFRLSGQSINVLIRAER